MKQPTVLKRVVRTAVLTDGTPIANAVVSVFDQDTGSPLRIYGGENGAPIPNNNLNQVTADEVGKFQFYAQQGKTLVLRAYDTDSRVIYEDYDIQPGVYGDRADISLPGIDSPIMFREGPTEQSDTVGNFVEAVLADLEDTDVLPVVRPDTWTKKTTLATVASFMAQISVGAALLQETSDRIPRKISELTAANALSPTDYTSVVQAGNTLRATLQDMANFMTQKAAGMYMRTPEGLVWGWDATPTEVTANTAATQSLVDEMAAAGGGIIYLYGYLKLGGIRWHPSVYLWGAGSGSTRLQIADNCPITTGDRRIGGSVVTGADAESRCLIYLLARAPFTVGQVQPTPTTMSWQTMFRGFSIDGNKANQLGHSVAGIWAEAGGSDPHYADVTAGSGNSAAYDGLRTDDVRVFNCSSHGIYVGNERRSCTLVNTVTQDNGLTSGNTVVVAANGFNLNATDVALIRCGGGGSTDFALTTNGNDSVAITQSNFWNSDVASTSAATCVEVIGAKSITAYSNTWAANVHFNAGGVGTTAAKPVVAVGNTTVYADALFAGQSDGVPKGLGATPWRNAAYSVTGYKQFTIKNNAVGQSASGKTYERLGWARSDAKGHFDFVTSTAAGVKPWTAAITAAIALDDTAKALYTIADSYTSRKYEGGDQVLGQGGLTRIDGSFGRASEDLTVTDGVDTILSGVPLVFLNAPDPLLNCACILPVPRGDGQTIDVYAGQVIQNFQMKVAVGAQDSPNDGDPLQPVTKSGKGLPKQLPLGAVVRFKYTKSVTQWRVQGVFYLDALPYDDPVRDYGADNEGVKETTQQVQEACDDANAPPPEGFSVGQGGTVQLQTGVYRVDQINLSRWVGLRGVGGALGQVVLRAYYGNIVTPGMDAVIKALDDGSQQSRVVGQQIISCISIDGEHAQAPVGHIRHGIWYKEPLPTQDNPNPTDRCPTLHSVHIANCPGDGIRIFYNDQIRGENFKVLSCDGYGLNLQHISDGKIDAIGIGGNVTGAIYMENCASLKIGRIDAWTSGNFTGRWLIQIISCKGTVLTDGELEGQVLVKGDNDNPANKAYRWDTMNVFQNITFKISVDFAASPQGNKYDCLVQVTDCFGVHFQHCQFGGFKELTPEIQTARPKYAIKITTGVADTDPNYASFYDTAGQVHCSDCTFLIHRGVTVGPLTSFPDTGFYLQLSNRPDLITGIRAGRIMLRIIGKQEKQELLCNGASVLKKQYPLGYLYTEPGATWTRKLTDGNDATTFNLPDFSAIPVPPGWGYYVSMD